MHIAHYFSTLCKQAITEKLKSNSEFVIRNCGVPCCPLLGGIVPPFWGNGADIVSAAYADELKKL